MIFMCYECKYIILENGLPYNSNPDCIGPEFLSASEVEEIYPTLNFAEVFEIANIERLD